MCKHRDRMEYFFYESLRKGSILWTNKGFKPPLFTSRLAIMSPDTYRSLKAKMLFYLSRKRTTLISVSMSPGVSLYPLIIKGHVHNLWEGIKHKLFPSRAGYLDIKMLVSIGAGVISEVSLLRSHSRLFPSAPSWPLFGSTLSRSCPFSILFVVSRQVLIVCEETLCTLPQVAHQVWWATAAQV